MLIITIAALADDSILNPLSLGMPETTVVDGEADGIRVSPFVVGRKVGFLDGNTDGVAEGRMDGVADGESVGLTEGRFVCPTRVGPNDGLMLGTIVGILEGEISVIEAGVFAIIVGYR